MWRPHVREVNQWEVQDLAQRAGLVVKHWEGQDCWPQLAGNDKQWRAKMAQHMTGGIIREDCIIYTLAPAQEGGAV